MKKNKIGCIITSIFLLCACSNKEQSTTFLHSVYLTQPVAISDKTIKKYSGIVKANHEISLGFKTAGQIKKIYVKEGDFVKQGQLLANLDDVDYRLAVDALQIQYEQLRDEVARTQRLFDQKSISANEYEKATAGLRQIEIQLQMNKNKCDYTKLYAPADGYIQSVNFSPAEMVDAGTSIFTLLDVSNMEVSVDIPVNEYLQRSHFVRFDCRATGIGENIQMLLSDITPKADGNQLYQMNLLFAERPDKRLTAGMNVEISITMADTTATKGFSVPLCSVFRDEETPCVWVFSKDSTVVKHPVVLHNINAEGNAVIIEGLTGKEQIVRTGVNALQAGEKVRVITKSHKTNVGDLL